VSDEEISGQMEVSTLYFASRGEADTVFSIVDVEDFTPGRNQTIASIIIALMRDGEVNPMSVMHKCSQASTELTNYFTTRIASEHYGTATYCANAVRDHATRQRVTATITRAYQALTVTSRPVDEVVAELGVDLEVAEASMNSGMTVIDYTEMIETPEESRPWVLPQMLRTNERLIITGPEGGGKSVLIAQLALGASMGVNTLDPKVGIHEPLRVLMLDVENDRLQIKSNMKKVMPYLNEMSGGRKPLIEWVNVRDIDLSDPVERQRVIRLAKERMPQLMYMGSLYKLAPEGEKSDAQFTHVSRTVDRIRAETGTSMLLEAHTGHGMNNDRNGAMRPYGSSMWLRWPEFGMAMIPSRTKPVRIKHWRGARSDDRTWPAGLKRGASLPWVPIGVDEWDALYGSDD
jgi:replicative DNA helicase